MSRHDDVMRLIDWSPRVELQYVNKPDATHRYVVTIDGWQDRTWIGEYAAMKALAEMAVTPPMKPHVSERELPIMRLIAAGFNKEQVAAEIGVTANTVKTHMERVRRRLNARNAPHLVAILKDGGVL